MNMHLAICHPCSRQIATLVLTSKDFARIAVVEQQLGEKPSRRTTCSCGENPTQVVTKISSSQVNTTSRQGIKQLGVSFGSIFLLFSNKSRRGPHSYQPGEISSPQLLMATLAAVPEISSVKKSRRPRISPGFQGQNPGFSITASGRRNSTGISHELATYFSLEINPVFTNNMI